MSKSINANISKKYNIGRYGNKGHYVEDKGKTVFTSNSSQDDYTNWLLAVDFAKKYFKDNPKTTKTMSTKKPTAKQLAARKKFAEAAKNGTLAKKRTTASKKKPLNTPLPKGMTKSVARAINVTGLRKADGTLKKGYKYAPGGKIVKATPKKK